MSLRLALKAAVFGASAVLVSPLALLSAVEKRLALGEAAFTFGAQLLALVPGLPGVWLRGAFYWFSLDGCSWQTHIGFGSVFTHRGAQLAARVSTGNYCVLGHVRIGADTRLASRVSIPSGRRQHLDEDGVLSDVTRFDTVNVGEGCWIGEAAIVMADVGAGCIVGAGAVVSRSMPERHLVSGNPASAVRELRTAHRHT